MTKKRRYYSVEQKQIGLALFKTFEQGSSLKDLEENGFDRLRSTRELLKENPFLGSFFKKQKKTVREKHLRLHENDPGVIYKIEYHAFKNAITGYNFELEIWTLIKRCEE